MFLFGHYSNSENQKCIDAAKAMLKSTGQLLFLPRSLSRWTSTHVWKEHFEAWDHISEHGEEQGPGEEPWHRVTIVSEFSIHPAQGHAEATLKGCVLFGVLAETWQ
jgi:hypothetical protein